VEVLEAIQNRRSIRRYQATPVDDKAVETVLEAARLAPSWANTQCWRFIVVRDEGNRNRIADTLFANPDVGEKNPAEKAIRMAPVLIVACAELAQSGFYNSKPTTDKGDWYMFDVALAMQNLVVAAHSLGLGTVHVGSFDAREVAGILKVPDGFCVVEMTPLGYPDQQPKPRPRKELAEIVFYESWGAQ
jgi:nitroreductase